MYIQCAQQYLQGAIGSQLKTEASSKALDDLANETLESQAVDEKLSRLLITTSPGQCDSTWAQTMRFLNSLEYSLARAETKKATITEVR